MNLLDTVVVGRSVSCQVGRSLPYVNRHKSSIMFRSRALPTLIKASGDQNVKHDRSNLRVISACVAMCLYVMLLLKNEKTLSIL